MRTTLHTAAVLAAVTVVAASAQPAMAGTATTTAAATTATAAATWSPTLASGSGAGVTVVDGVARIDPDTAFLAPPEPAPFDPTQPDAGPLGPALSAPPQPDPAKPGPTQPDSAKPGSALSTPPQPNPAQPDAVQSGPAQPQPTPPLPAAPTVRIGRSRAVDATPGTAGAGTAGVARATPEGKAAPLRAVQTGLLTLPEHTLTTATDHITTSVSTQAGASGDAAVDVRGLRATGNWSEWITAGADGAAVLPESSAQVQARLVLTGDPGPVVTAVTLTAAAPSQTPPAAAAGAPLTAKVYATREGLTGGTTANGHVIASHDHFVALPSRRALSPNGKSDYSVRVCASNGRCVFAPVWDVGPWNTHDDYWNPAALREQWADLPQGTPQAQAAYRNGYNGGKDQYDRHVVNPAGIDLGDGVFWDDLGLVTNSTVTVTYLWTGDVRLAKVVDTGPVLASPEAKGKVVGIAANDAGVPVECTAGDWLRIGTGQYLAAAAVPDIGEVGPCDYTAVTSATRYSSGSSETTQ